MIMHFCSHCGKEVSDAAIICPNCGCETQPNSYAFSVDSSRVGLPGNNPVGYDFILYTILCGLSIGFLFLNKFFSYFEIHEVYPAGFSGYLLDYDKDSKIGPFAELFRFEGDSKEIFFIVSIICLLAVAMIAEWIAYFRKDRIRLVSVISSSAALGLFLLGSISGVKNFHSEFVMDWRGYSDIKSRTTWGDASLGIVFFLILAFMILLLILSILNEKKIYLLKKRSL